MGNQSRGATYPSPNTQKRLTKKLTTMVPPVASTFAASFGRAVSDSLVPRVMAAARLTGYGKIAVAGGVAANSRIRADLERACAQAGAKLWLPPLALCGDNAAMIGSQGYYEYLAGHTAGWELNAKASLDIGRG